MRRLLELLYRHTPALCLGVAVALSVALMSLGEAEQSVARTAVQTVLWPSQRAVSLVEEYTSLWDENRRLRRELAENNLNEDVVASLVAENERLRDLLDFPKRSEIDLIPAQVVRRDAGPLLGEMLIDRGSSHGIRERMTVVSTEGLVGRVVSARSANSDVELLTAKGFAVSARVEGRGVSGIVKWHPDRRQLRMHNVPVQDEVHPGDIVVTSSLGGNFVDGVRIGAVKRVDDDEDGLFKIVELEAPTYLWSLREVFVIPKASLSPFGIYLAKPGDDSDGTDR